MELVQVSNNPDGTTLITINRPARKNAICATTARADRPCAKPRYAVTTAPQTTAPETDRTSANCPVECSRTTGRVSLRRVPRVALCDHTCSIFVFTSSRSPNRGPNADRVF